jgi:signal-transduction protein with cAMP-binding, CBS, and nucleotidyltransferase domain
VSVEASAGMDEAGRTLDQVPGFRAMPEEVRRLVADAFELVDYEFGSTIVREGDDADAFYVLVSGSARVLKHAGTAEEISLNVLRRGDSFGEIGLLDESTRVATVRASGPVQALRLDRGVFRALTRRQPQVRANLLRLYSTFRSLPDADLARIAAALEPCEAAEHELVIREGAEPGPLYVVEEGR